jgi:RNA polymerase primary sigma factor
MGNLKEARDLQVGGQNRTGQQCEPATSQMRGPGEWVRQAGAGSERYEAYEEEEPFSRDDFENVANSSIPDIIQHYLKEIGNVALLTASEEVELAERMERGNAAQRRLDASEPVSYQLRLALLSDIQAGLAAQEYLTCANLRLVVSVAKKYIGRGLSLLDLIQEGNIGLMRAVRKFDPNKGNRFSTYATWWIRQSVTRALAEQGRTIRLPVHMGEQVMLLRRTTEYLAQALERQPTPEEVALAMNIPLERVKRIIDISRQPVSLETPVGEDGEHTLGDFVENSEATNPTVHAAHQMLRRDLDKALSRLTEREQRIIALRYGLNDGHHRTLEEVGNAMGLTRERARQIEVEALRRLRLPNIGLHLRDYLE